MEQYTFSIADGAARNPSVRLAQPVTAQIAAGEHITIVGPNGEGKSLFVDTLLGKYPSRGDTVKYDFSPSPAQTAYNNVKYIAFRNTYGAADASYYYQQRWDTHDQGDAPSVQEMLGEIKDERLGGELFEILRIEPLLDKEIIFLSSRELRKFQLAKALLTTPRILIMDNPFIGLDAPTRELLFFLFERLTRLSSVQIILVFSMLDDIPSFITHVIPVGDLTMLPKMERGTYLAAFHVTDIPVTLNTLQRRITGLPYDGTNYGSGEVVELSKVGIRYDGRAILRELDWTVHRGGKWALNGENGTGKSTLLSLVCADNSQPYACDISLFGHKRDTGENIWEIKEHIGYISPEMRRTYLKNLPTVGIVASGLRNSIGLYKRPQESQMATCEWWMNVFGVAALKDEPFLQLSSGKQHLTLLAHALVEDPELLILDEPLYRLDTYNRRRVERIIEAFCRRQDKTVIMVTRYKSEPPSTITDHPSLRRNH